MLVVPKGSFKFFRTDWLETPEEDSVAVFVGVGSESDVVLADLASFEVLEDSIADESRSIGDSSLAVFDADLLPEFAFLSELFLSKSEGTLRERSRSSMSSTGEFIFRKSFLSV